MHHLGIEILPPGFLCIELVNGDVDAFRRYREYERAQNAQAHAIICRTPFYGGRESDAIAFLVQRLPCDPAFTPSNAGEEMTAHEIGLIVEGELGRSSPFPREMAIGPLNQPAYRFRIERR